MLQYAHDSIIERILGNNELVYYSTEDRIELFRGCYGIFKYLPQDLSTNSDFIMEMLKKGFRIQYLLPTTMKYDSNAHFSLSHYSSVNEKHTFITIQGTDNYKQLYLNNFSLIPRELRNDKLLVMELIDRYAGKIMEVDDNLCDDPEIISFTISKDPSLFEYASERLKDDFNFVMEHIEKYPEIYTNVSARLRGNKEIIYKYVSRADRPYFCGKPFVDDEEFLFKLVERNSNFLSSLDSISPELARKCIERNGSSYATLLERQLIAASDELIELAALSTGFLFEKHTCSLVVCEGGEAGKVIRPSISVTRNEVDLWIKKRLESEFDGLYISSSSPMLVKGNFVTVNETVYTFRGKSK